MGPNQSSVPKRRYRDDHRHGRQRPPGHEWGGDCSGSGATCELTMDGDKTASVTFEVTRTLRTSTGANGGIDPAAGMHTYASGVSVTVTAAPDSGYRVDEWGGDCSGSAATCVLTMDADKTASVTFERDEYVLTTSAGANGSVSPAAGAHTYDAGTSVTVTATPGTDHRVASWGGDCSGTALTCDLTMDANKTASVTFQRGVTYTLTASATGGGSVSPDGITAHRPNAAVVLTATWLEWTHAFTGWGGDCSGTAATCTLTMNANKTATATFKALPRLTVFTSGSADGEVIIEWTAGAEVATRWQYRQRGPVWQGVQYRLSGTELVEVEGEVWGASQDVPGSTATTSSYRLSGLQAGFGYDFQVRPWTTSGAGTRAGRRGRGSWCGGESHRRRCERGDEQPQRRVVVGTRAGQRVVARPCSRGGGRPPWPGRRSHRSSSRGRS